MISRAPVSVVRIRNQKAQAFRMSLESSTAGAVLGVIQGGALGIVMETRTEDGRSKICREQVSQDG